MRTVDVFFNDIKAGVLCETEPGGACIFTYEDAYLNADYPSVSPLLRKNIKSHTSPFLFPFFCNLLPEGGNKKVICRHYKIDENDIFGLLYAMADAEFVGAINIRNARNE